MTMLPPEIRTRNQRVLTAVIFVIIAMIGLSFAAVPLYRLFCDITGFGGTTQVSETLPAAEDILDRSVKIRFNTDTGRNMLWRFDAEQRQVEVRLGQKGLIAFTARNDDRVPVTGVAVYNVTPPKAGKYFHKVECFCFAEQTLNPGEEASYPVAFFIDPALDRDPNMQDVTTITLSYTFFAAESPELDAAMESFTATQPAPARDPATAGTVALPPEKQ